MGESEAPRSCEHRKHAQLPWSQRPAEAQHRHPSYNFTTIETTSGQNLDRAEERGVAGGICTPTNTEKLFKISRFDQVTPGAFRRTHRLDCIGNEEQTDSDLHPCRVGGSVIFIIIVTANGKESCFSTITKRIKRINHLCVICARRIIAL